jgi:hypothetical protein
MWKLIFKLIHRKQDGAALILALAVLGIGSLMLAPTLSIVGTGLKAGVTTEDQMDMIYACDAGVQDAIWVLNNLHISMVEVPEEDNLDTIWEDIYFSDEGWQLTINDYVVNVRIQYTDTLDSWPVYRVWSWIPKDLGDITNYGNNEMIVEAMVTTTWNDFSGITQHVVTSQGDYEIDNKVDVTPPGPYDPDTNPNGARDNYDGHWPTPEDLIAYYSRDVDKDNPYPDEVIDLNGDDLFLGPIYRDGDLSIINSSNQDATLYLTGTIYVTGDISFAITKKEFTVDLDGDYLLPENEIPQTIFSESRSGIADSKIAIEIDGRCTMTGSGCVIAVGNIVFKPNMNADPADYILVLSIEDETEMYPSGDFYGTLAGSVHVDVKSGETPSINWNGPPPDINFPGSTGGEGMIYSIHTWSYWGIGP